MVNSMPTTRDDGGPAFPQKIERPSGLGTETTTFFGMSLRDYFAGQALAGINANNTWDESGWGARAVAAYESADAMITARKSGGDAP